MGNTRSRYVNETAMNFGRERGTLNVSEKSNNYIVFSLENKNAVVVDVVHPWLSTKSLWDARNFSWHFFLTGRYFFRDVNSTG